MEYLKKEEEWRTKRLTVSNRHRRHWRNEHQSHTKHIQHVAVRI